jgi:hypothetical protein
MDDPKFNLTVDPYVTDGMRMIFWISQEPIPSHMAIDLGWNESADPAREAPETRKAWMARHPPLPEDIAYYSMRLLTKLS